jgi:CO/xanthine dehydrogenase Mo-binding subunit
MGARTFGCAITGEAACKAPAEHRVLGKHVQRVDIEDKLFGAPRFVHDLARDALLHGRVVRPASPHAVLRSVEIEPVRAMPGVVEIVRDGSFLGVVAEREEQVVAAADALRARCVFEDGATLPDQAAIFEQLKTDLFGSYPLVNGTPVEQPVPAPVVPEGAAHTCSATYTRPFLMHASIGPSAALALYADDKFEVHCSCQGPSVLQAALAQALRIDAARVRVVHAEGAGCYGHNGADDAALDAALLARAVPGRAVLLKWSRADEHAHEPYGPAMRVEVSASLDAAGRVIAYNHDAYSYTHIGRAFPGGHSSALIAAQQMAEPLQPPRPRPMLAPQAGVHRNADPLYEFANVRVVKHLANNAPLRTSSLRSLGAFTNVFAMESMMDELAVSAGIDPVALRLNHLGDARAREVIEAGAARAGFDKPKPAADARRPIGRGMAFSRYENHKCYAAVFVELEVDLAGFVIHLKRAVIAADAGLIVDPDGLANQLEGGFIQAASWTLTEQVHFDAHAITSLDWESYPIARFDEVPEVEVVLIDRPDETSRGAGEATTGPAPAAIANAVYDACGARLRSTPFTPAKLRRALYDGDT